MNEAKTAKEKLVPFVLWGITAAVVVFFFMAVES